MDANDEGETIDVRRAAMAAVGATRGELEVEIGPPNDRPDHAEVTVRRDEAEIVCSVDVAAGEHGTGHADVTLSESEALALRDALDALIE